MKANRYIVIAALVLGFLASCTKENGRIKESGPASADTTETGGTPPPADSTYKGVVTNNYQPDTSGSTWTYQTHQVFNFSQSTLGELEPSENAVFGGLNIDTTFSYHVQALSGSTQVGGLTYRNYSNDFEGGVFNPAIALSNGTYTGVDVLWEVLWVGGNNFGGFSLNDDTLLYLKEQPKGTSWSETTILQDSFGFSDTTTYTFTIKATGLTRAVNGINYPNVIQVESKTAPGFIAQFASILASEKVDVYTTTEYYYAENVGLIEEDLSEPLMGVTITTILLASTIK